MADELPSDESNSLLMGPESLVCSWCWNNVFLSDKFAEAIWALEVTEKYDLKGRFEYEDVIERIYQSAEEGCSWCKFIAAGRWLKGMSHNVTISFSSYQRELNQSPPGNYIFSMGFSEGGSSISGVGLMVFSDEEDVAAPFVKSRPLQTKVNTDAAFKQARAWIAKCDEHKECRGLEKTCMPTRVIEVSPGENLDHPRLLESKGQEGSYAALSYCWGANQPGVTTLKSLPARLIEIKPDELSQTARDAIHCTKQLGIEYLWIDALCIIQDSDDDKAREIANMRNVYQNSLVTILAANSDSARNGFLEDRPALYPPFRVPWPCPNKQMGTVSVMKSGGYWEYKYEPLSGRAWALQESLISPRLLVYTSQTLMFECQATIAYLGDWLHHGHGHPRLPNYIALPQQQHMSTMTPKQIQDTIEDWGRILYEYTDRNITYPSDRLLALGAVAELFSNFLETKYLAGLFEKYLQHNIHWYVSKDTAGMLKPRPSEPRYPSWSWVSVDDEVQFFPFGKDAQYTCEVLKCNVELIHDSFPFGSAKSGSIRMKGVMREAWLWGKSMAFWSEAKAKSNATCSSSDVVKVNCDAQDDIKRLTTVHLFSTVVYVFGVAGLVLLPLGDGSDSFRRIGLFKEAKKGEFGSRESTIVTIV